MQYGCSVEESLEAVGPKASGSRDCRPIEECEGDCKELIEQSKARPQVLNWKARPKCHRRQAKEATIAQALQLHGQLKECPLIEMEEEERGLEQTDASHEPQLQARWSSSSRGPIANEAEQKTAGSRE